MTCSGQESDPMSRRTADASKAIRLAWEKEQQRVLEGEGTRDWTEKQQQDIIDRGKAYDEDGKAFEDMEMAITALKMQQKMIEHCERKCKGCPCWDGKSDLCLNDFIIDTK